MEYASTANFTTSARPLPPPAIAAAVRDARPGGAPPIIPPDPDGIPAELRDLPQWVAFELTWNEAKGKYGKVPKNPRTGGNASSTDPTTWGTFAEAVSRMERDRLQAIGFAFAAGLGFVGVDLDRCRDHRTGALSDDAREIAAQLGTYAEPSASGTGIHLIGRGALPGKGRNEGNVEMYDVARFFVFTGRPLPDHDEITDCQDGITVLYREAFGDRPEPHPVDRGDGDEPPVLLSPKALAVWRGERPKVNTVTGRVDRSTTVVKIARVLFDAGMTRRGIFDELVARDRALYQKYTGRADATERYHEIIDLIERDGRTPRPVLPDGAAGDIADLRERLARAEARAAELAARHTRLAQALQATGLPAAERLTLVGLMLELGHAASAHPEAVEHPIPLARIAERVGASAPTVSRHLKRVERLADGATGEIVRLFERRTFRDPNTGRSHALYRPRLSVDEVLELMPRAVPLDGLVRHGHGGARIVCPDHPDARVVRRVTYHCEVCDRQLGTAPDDDAAFIMKPAPPHTPCGVLRARKLKAGSLDAPPGGAAAAWLDAAPLSEWPNGAQGGGSP